MLLIFEDGDEDAFLKVQGLAQSASRIELMEFRSQQSTSALEIRENQRRVFCKGREIPLTKTEYEILLYLFQNINQVLTHDQIYEKSLEGARLWRGSEACQPSCAVNSAQVEFRKRFQYPSALYP